VQAVRGIDLDISMARSSPCSGPTARARPARVEILEGYRRRDGGEVAVLGCDPGRDRAKMLPHVGIELQKTGIDRYLTVIETVRSTPATTQGRDHRTRPSSSPA